MRPGEAGLRLGRGRAAAMLQTRLGLAVAGVPGPVWDMVRAFLACRRGVQGGFAPLVAAAKPAAGECGGGPAFLWRAATAPNRPGGRLPGSRKRCSAFRNRC